MRSNLFLFKIQVLDLVLVGKLVVAHQVGIAAEVALEAITETNLAGETIP